MPSQDIKKGAATLVAAPFSHDLLQINEPTSFLEAGHIGA
jgi:hypothetical protein